MKSSLVIAFLLCAAWCSALDVVFTLRDFIGGTQPLQNAKLVMDPQSTPFGSGTTIVTSERRYFNLGTNSTYTVTNAATGAYLVQVWGITTTSKFGIFIPDLPTGSTNASRLITSTALGSLQDEDGDDLQPDL